MRGFAHFSKIDDPIEATDLEKLPEVLERKIRSAPYSKALWERAREWASGFARYRIAVLFSEGRWN